MITDKLMMPYLLVSHHPMVHLGLGIAGIIVIKGEFHIENNPLWKKQYIVNDTA